MTPLRKKIITLARSFDGKVLTAFQAMDLSATLGSMDDTLTDEEVYMFLENIANGVDYDFVISAAPVSKDLVMVHVNKHLTVTKSPAPFSRS